MDFNDFTRAPLSVCQLREPFILNFALFSDLARAKIFPSYINVRGSLKFLITRARHRFSKFKTPKPLYHERDKNFFFILFIGSKKTSIELFIVGDSKKRGSECRPSFHEFSKLANLSFLRNFFFFLNNYLIICLFIYG